MSRRTHSSRRYPTACTCAGLSIPTRGFPWFGYFLFRRESRGKGEVRSVTKGLRNERGIFGPAAIPASFGALESDRPLFSTDDFAPTGQIEVDLDQWRAVWDKRRPSLTFRLLDGQCEIVDDRDGIARAYGLDRRATTVIETCAPPRLRSDVLQSPGADEALLDELDRHGLIFQDGGHIVSLSLPAEAG